MMKNKDLIEQEKKEREASAKALPVENQEGEQVQQPDTQPEEHGGSGKMFTQEEVNRIVSERLARERAKSAPSEDETRAKELDARESRIKCRDYLDQHQLTPEVLDLFSTDSYDEFVQSAENLMSLFDGMRERPEKADTSTKGRGPEGLFRQVFGLK